MQAKSKTPAIESGSGRIRQRYGLALLLSCVVLCAGCSAASVYKKAAMVGIDFVGDAIDEDQVQKESQALLNQPIAAADQRYGRPLNVFVDLQTQREVRVYPVDKDLLGNGRWVVEAQDGQVAAVSKAKINPSLGEDAVKATALDQLVTGKTAAEIAELAVLDKLLFSKPPRVLRFVPAGNLLRIYDVTGFTDLTGARFVVLEFDDRDRCKALKFVGVPAERRAG